MSPVSRPVAYLGISRMRLKGNCKAGGFNLFAGEGLSLGGHYPWQCFQTGPCLNSTVAYVCGQSECLQLVQQLPPVSPAPGWTPSPCFLCALPAPTDVWLMQERWPQLRGKNERLVQGHMSAEWRTLEVSCLTLLCSMEAKLGGQACSLHTYTNTIQALTLGCPRQPGLATAILCKVQLKVPWFIWFHGHTDFFVKTLVRKQ